jgi:hypothetical protein
MSCDICSKSVEFNLVQLMQKNDLYCVKGKRRQGDSGE